MDYISKSTLFNCCYIYYLARYYFLDLLKECEHILIYSKPFFFKPVIFGSNQEELPYHEKKQQIR